MVKAISLLLLSAACAIVTAAGPIKLPLYKSNKPTSIKKRWESDARRWSGLNTNPKSIPATNEVGLYTIRVGFGTPVQYAELEFDTGSSFLWVYDQNYNTEKSTTVQATNITVSHQYGSGAGFNTTMFKDYVNFGGFEIDQYFGVRYNSTDIAGVFGAGRGLYTHIDGKRLPTPIEELFNHHKIPKNIFGVDFRPVKGSQPVVNGEIDLGGIDYSKIKGNITYVPLSKADSVKHFWGLDISSIKFGDRVVLSGTSGILDTGSTFIFLPEDAVSKLYSRVPGAKYDPDSSLYKIPRDQIHNLKEFTITIGGEPFTLSPAQYLLPTDQYVNYGVTGDDHYSYITTFPGMPLGIQVILGQMFLENYYSVYDATNKRVGLAHRK